MRISRHHSVDDWNRLRFEREADWQRGIDMLEDRLRSRYLEHIEVLLERETSQFAVLTLDSALIECLEQFHNGVRTTPHRQGQKYFEAFLTRTMPDWFDRATAGLFYKTIRCGLAHSAETSDGSRLKRSGPSAPVSRTVDGTGLVIDVPAFHARLKAVITDYLAALRVPDHDGSKALRSGFRRKMNYICNREGAAPA